MRSKVVSLQVGNFHVGKSWRLESERFTCLREGGGIMLGTTRYVGAPQHMLGTTIYMLGHHNLCWAVLCWGTTSYVGALIYIYMSKGGRGLCLGTAKYVLARIIYVGTLLNMLGHHDICWSLATYVGQYFICWGTNIYLHVYGRAGDYV